MKKECCVVLSLVFGFFLTACSSTKDSAKVMDIREQPSAVIHILDDSSDSDYKFSKVNDRKIERMKSGKDTVKVPSGKTIMLHFEKSSMTSTVAAKEKTTSVEKTDNACTWTVESPGTSVTDTIKVFEIIFDCPELQENQEYTLSVSAEGFRLEESSTLTLITEGKFQ